MGLTFNNGRNADAITSDSSLNVGIGAAPSGSYKFEVTGTSKFSTDSLVSGLTIGKGGGSVSTNTAIGYNALTANSSGYWNVALGYNALSGGNISAANVAIGYNAFSGASFVGGQNIGMGISAGSSLTSGGNNTLIGYLAGYSLTTGSSNIFIGYNTLNTVTTGSFNTVIGGFPSFSSSPSLSNNVIIADGAGNTRFWWDGSTLRLPTVVSIGNTNSTYNLDVTGTGRFTGALNGTSATFSGTINANSANSQIKIGGATTDAFIGVSTSTLYLTDWATAAKGLTINLSTGAATFSSSVTATQFNASISTSGAVSAVPNLAYFKNQGNSYVARIAIGDGTTSDSYISHTGGNTTATQYLGFGVNAYNQMVLTAAGNVGIGTTSPFVGGNPAKLQVRPATDINIGFQVGTADTTGIKLNAYNDAASVNIPMELNGSIMILKTGETERMRITSAGFLKQKANGGNYFSPTSYNEISNFAGGSSDVNLVLGLGGSSNNTSSYFLICAPNNAGDRMYIYGNGNIVNTNGSYGTLSDATLKENIIDATPKLNDLLQLKVRNFNLIDDENKTKQIGFIAQEFEEVFPTMVDTDGKSGMKTIKTSVLVPMLVKAIQEQNQIIKDLEARIVSLESK